MGANKTSLYLYYLTIFVLSLGAFYVFHRITLHHPPDYLFTEKCILCAISSFFNLFVLHYHYTHAPHPKFLMLKKRRFVIYTHIISGVLEFITCWTAFCTGNERIATIASLVAILGHVPSAYYQTSVVFGAKALIVSGYLFVISLHLFSALNLFNNPSSTYWLLNMFLVHNIYVWCRVFYFFYSFVGVFKDTLHTNSIITSCLILFPAVLGVSGNMLFFGYVATSVLLYLMIVRPNEADRALFISERTRDLLVNPAIHSQWLNEKIRLLNMATEHQLTDQQKAKRIFDHLDKDKNGYIDGEEMNELLKEWQVADAFMKRFTRRTNNNVTYDQFYKNIWRLGNESTSHVKDGQIKQNKAKARFVFDCLNTDADEHIDAAELQKLLIQWGLPDNEVEEYLSNDDDKRFSFEEFYQNLKPIWDFAYENMGISNSGQMASPSHPHSN